MSHQTGTQQKTTPTNQQPDKETNTTIQTTLLNNTLKQTRNNQPQEPNKHTSKQ